MEFKEEWKKLGSKEGKWNKKIDVRDFIQNNYTPYEGDSSFLAGPTEKTKKLWNEVLDLYQKERENGEFISKEELRKRTKISKTVIETLTNHGSLDNMSDENQLSLF